MANLKQLQDQAIYYIANGAKLFNQSEFEKKIKGYEYYTQGINLLIAYGKQEPNELIKQSIKENLKQYLQKVQEMKTTLEIIKTNQEDKTQNIQNQQPKPQNKPQEKLNNPELNDLAHGLMDAIITEKPNVKWSDIAGLENAKSKLHEAVILPTKFPDLFKNLKPWKGILLYGPPGTGKTFLAKACATECNATFFSISSSDLISKYVGESEKLIKVLFKMAREKKPSIIFIDEIDSLTGSRSDGENEASRRVKTEFLTQMDGVGNSMEGILILGATNIPWGLDPAIRRRFEKRVYIPLPEIDARAILIYNLLKQTPNSISQEEIDYVACVTQGFSGSDIQILLRDASYEPLRKCQSAKKFKQIDNYFMPCKPSDPSGKELNFQDLIGKNIQLPLLDIDDINASLIKCKPSVSENDIKQHVKFTLDFGEEG